MTSVVLPALRNEMPGAARSPAVAETRERTLHPWVVVLAAGYLVAVLFSKWNAPAILVTGISAVVFAVRFIVRGKIDRIGWGVIVYLLALTGYGIAVGSAPTLAGLGRFLSFEGRPYVAYLPALVLATAAVTDRDLDAVRTLMRWSVVFGAALVVAWLAVGPSVLGRGGNFTGFASSHHASGFFFAIAGLVLLVPADGGRRSMDVALGVIAFGIVVASGSRTSMAGLLVAAIYLVVSAPSLRRKLRLVLLTGAAAMLALLLSGKFFETVQYLGSSAFLQGATIEFSQGATPEQGKGLSGVSSPNGTIANILIRFGVWRASEEEFTKSPLIGIGPWRLNDTDRHEVGVPGLMMLATGGERVSGSGFGAHNLVLETLAETGVLGLALLAAPWWLLIARLRRQRRWGRAAISLIAFGVGTLATSNAMISPALCFPLFVFAMAAARVVPGANATDPVHQA